ncbi:uncharacterized protein L3040_000013 [Drepanopeziza brunnea f. sp. 'multigermtubi']|nr:hypothetical protein L3040_000013 [Drepanopeziza brunnea f. sp. 'multigermtubi']
MMEMAAELSTTPVLIRDDTKSEDEKEKIKDDPDAVELISENKTGRKIPAPRKIKEEPTEYVKIDLTLPDGEDDMFEDVDELDEDGNEIVDLTYEGIAHVNGVRHFVCEGFKIRQIPEPFIVKRTLIDIFRCVESKSIVLDPDYQREEVWDEGRASLLITSMLMGYFIPPIIFNVKKKIVQVDGRDEERFLRTCVDGKQRLTSIYKFMKGKIGFLDTNTPQKKWFFCHPIINGQIQISNRNVLPNAVKKFFEKQFFCCYEYEDLTPDTEETMFQLVQRGIALTPAEKMRTMSTEWAAFTRQFEDDYALIVNLSKQSRASGFRLILTIFNMIREIFSSPRRKRYSRSSSSHRTLSTPPLQASPQALLRLLDSKTPIPLPLKATLKAVFTRYEHLVKLSSTQITATRFKVNTDSAFDPAPKYLRANILMGEGTGHVRTFSPLELVSAAILVAVHMEHRDDDQLLEDVKEMRTFMRRKHKDLRVNAQCWATGWTFITSEMDVRRSYKGKLHRSIEGKSSGARMDTDGDESPLSSVPTSDSESGSESQEEPLFSKKKALGTRSQTRRKVSGSGGAGSSRKGKGKGKGKIFKSGQVAKRPKPKRRRKTPIEPVFENLE